ncbi:MAG: alpha/beta fold hydrolase [Acidimicrobiia bacterium]|nr:alpha/beta fold hydrolase [Acidimicrobiia bacterium]
MSHLALHGFTQRGAMWDEVAGLVGGPWAAPDLPGHAGQPICDWDEAVARVGEWLRGLPRPRALVGYSMGGRLALGAALEHAELVDSLVLLSASPGIGDAQARRERLEADRGLADRIEAIGLSAFLEEWLARPWFGGGRTPPPEWRQAEHAARSAGEATGVAEALRRLGQGSQPYYGDRLGELRPPVVLVAGSDDAPYAALACRMGAAAARSRVVLLGGAGHAVVAERPGEVAVLLESAGVGE